MIIFFIARSQVARVLFVWLFFPHDFLMSVAFLKKISLNKPIGCQRRQSAMYVLTPPDLCPSAFATASLTPNSDLSCSSFNWAHFSKGGFSAQSYMFSALEVSMWNGFTFTSEEVSRVFSGPEKSFHGNFSVWVRVPLGSGRLDSTPLNDVGFSLGPAWRVSFLSLP